MVFRQEVILRSCTLRVHKVLKELVLLAVKVQMETPAREGDIEPFGGLSFETLKLVSPACPEAACRKMGTVRHGAQCCCALHLPTQCGTLEARKRSALWRPAVTRAHWSKILFATTQRQRTVVGVAFSIVLSWRKSSARSSRCGGASLL